VLRLGRVSHVFSLREATSQSDAKWVTSQSAITLTRTLRAGGGFVALAALSLLISKVN